jgi:hypothetical protein
LVRGFSTGQESIDESAEFALLIGSFSARAFVAASLLGDPSAMTFLMVHLNFLCDPPPPLYLLCMPSYDRFVPSPRRFDVRKPVSAEGGVCGGVF